MGTSEGEKKGKGGEKGGAPKHGGCLCLCSGCARTEAQGRGCLERLKSQSVSPRDGREGLRGLRRGPVAVGSPSRRRSCREPLGHLGREASEEAEDVAKRLLVCTQEDRGGGRHGAAAAAARRPALRGKICQVVYQGIDAIGGLRGVLLGRLPEKRSDDFAKCNAILQVCGAADQQAVFEPEGVEPKDVALEPPGRLQITLQDTWGRAEAR